MTVKRLELHKFSVFQKAEMDFSPGINVFIGANGTGKSHLLKLLYCLLKTAENAHRDRTSDEKHVTAKLREKLGRVFRPDELNVGRLVRRTRGRISTRAWIDTDGGEIGFTLWNRGDLSLHPSSQISIPGASLFIPSREVLSIYEGFIQAYEKRELAFDETVYDLCVALAGSPLRETFAREVTGLAKPLEDMLGGHVVLKGNRFYRKTKDGLLEAHLLAEGLRKVASLLHLVQTGSLSPGGALFWDEPEANLNPRLIAEFATLVQEIAAAGIQVFLATHDFLLSQSLSLAAEYPHTMKAPLRFFALSLSKAGAARVTVGDNLVELEPNPILEEFAAHYDREQRLFAQSHHQAKKARS